MVDSKCKSKKLKESCSNCFRAMTEEVECILVVIWNIFGTANNLEFVSSVHSLQSILHELYVIHAKSAS